MAGNANRQFHKSQENEVQLNLQESFRVNSFLVIIDKLIFDLDKRRVAYVAINEKFKAIIQFESLSSIELEIAARTLVSFFPNYLEKSLRSELLHLKSHLATLD